MFVWVGTLLPKDYEMRVRDICNSYNHNICASDVAFSLPQHISLKISFECGDYLNAISVIEGILCNVKPFDVDVVGVSRIPNIIWLDIDESKVLGDIHNALDDNLFEKLDIKQHVFDKDFKFHSTLYLDEDTSKLETMFNLLKNRDFKETLEINSFAIGVSESGKPGTYDIIKIIKTH